CSRALAEAAPAHEPWRRRRLLTSPGGGGASSRALAVADQFDVAVTRDLATCLEALHDDRAFPVARTDDQLLCGDAWRQLEHEGTRGERETPARRVGDSASRTSPGGQHLDPNVVPR